MREISAEQLREILSEHQFWLHTGGGDKGKRANLRGVDLRRTNLQRANLRGADLRGADLREVDLRRTNLQRANLRGADLREVDLREVDLRGANLREVDLRRANLRRANLYEVDLREVDLRGVDLRGAINTEHAFVDQAQRAILGLTDDDTVTQLQQQIKHAEQAIQEKKELKRKIQQLEDNTQNQKDKQIEIDKLEEKLEEKTAEAEQVALLKIKLKNATVQRDESQDKELEDAIEKISNSNKDGSDTLKTYKKNSTFLMQFGIILFFSAILIAGYIYYSKIFSVDISNLSSFHLVLFSPSFVLAFAGTALLRHDWKIRQLTQQLITQNNHIDIATGILTASLNLTRIDNIEKEELSLLRDSFTSVRQALLFKENTSSNNTNNQESLDKEGELSASIKTLSRYIKNI
ncbi:pentapeptide repeat-containing protein [bacterium endosymbiont of Bathymodiolus sp. 5 South]|uniref:pentapeptide repeat-containing protein n=1 Tax=bacterium endosymbiont of Bathymodiolus sp. 5 South TaxID=1181670 RepID=UPI0010BA01D1|nr:pentapeptide repeat family protein [bacterium endosymbiont of Bathymodiolus sp. 5 South]